jgi:hypothetical protein
MNNRIFNGLLAFVLCFLLAGGLAQPAGAQEAGTDTIRSSNSVNPRSS